MTLFKNENNVWKSVAKQGATLILILLATASMAASCDDCDSPKCCEADADAGTENQDPEDQQPELLTDLDSFMEALNGGEDVRAVFYYADCELNGAGPGPDAVGGMSVQTYEWFAEGSIGNAMAYVAFSKSSVVLLGNDYIYDYVKARVYEDGTVTLIVEYLDVVTWDVEMHEQFTCGINQNADDTKGVSLFRQL